MKPGIIYANMQPQNYNYSSNINKKCITFGNSENEILEFTKGGKRLQIMTRGQMNAYYYDISKLLSDGNKDAKEIISGIGWTASEANGSKVSMAAKPLYTLDKAGIYGKDVIKFLDYICDGQLRVAFALLEGVDKGLLEVQDITNAVKNSTKHNDKHLGELMVKLIKNVK